MTCGLLTRSTHSEYNIATESPYLGEISRRNRIYLDNPVLTALRRQFLCEFSTVETCVSRAAAFQKEVGPLYYIVLVRRYRDPPSTLILSRWGGGEGGEGGSSDIRSHNLFSAPRRQLTHFL